MYPKTVNQYARDTCAPRFTAALFIIAKLYNQPRFPTTDDWIKKKKWYIYIMEYYSAIKIKIILFARKMDRTGDHDVGQDMPRSERQISHIFSLYLESRPKNNNVT
jgi:hypothetical protein